MAARRSGPDAIEQIEAEAADALRREEVREQGAVEEVDGERAALHVGTPQRVVARKKTVVADVAAVAARRHDQFADGRGIAQPEIEPLRADRRHQMGGFADQRNAIEPERADGFDRQREYAAAGFDGNLAEQRMRAPLDLGVERRVVERLKLFGVVRIGDADQARTIARQWHQRERAGLGVKLGGRVAVRPRMREVERQRGLRIAAAAALDAGGRAAQRAPAVGADNEAGGRRCRRLSAKRSRHCRRFRPRRRHPRSGSASRAPAPAPPAPQPDAGSRYCGRTRRGRSRPPQTAPRARG